MLLKNPVTPPGIDPGTVRLVAQRLNHYATPGPYTAGSANVKVHNICNVRSKITCGTSCDYRLAAMLHRLPQQHDCGRCVIVNTLYKAIINNNDQYQ